MYIREHAINNKTFTENGKWISAWGTSPVDFNIALKDIVKLDLKLRNVLKAGTTTRTELTVTGSGEKIKLHFSNLFGKKAVKLSKITVARTDTTGTANVIDGTVVSVTFDSKDSVVMEPGSKVVSDEIELAVSALEKLSVSIYFEEKTIVNTCGLYSAVTYTAKGTKTCRTRKTAFNQAKKFCLSSGSMGCNFIPFLTGVDVYSPHSDASCIVMLGDSTFCNDAYIHLEERLLSADCHNISVVNKAISGNKLLNYGCGLIGSFYGPPVMKRFFDDVIEQAGVKAVVIKIGVNDITHPYIKSMKGKALPVTKEEIFAAFTELSELCHKNSIKIYLSTIAPWNGYEREILGKKGDLTWTPEQYEYCCQVNEWIRATDVIDGFIDVDELSSPDDITRLYPPFTTDCMHFSPLGAIAFSDIIPLGFFGCDKEGDLLLETRYKYFPSHFNQATEESGDFGEGFYQALQFLSQFADHLRFKK